MPWHRPARTNRPRATRHHRELRQWRLVGEELRDAKTELEGAGQP